MKVGVLGGGQLGRMLALAGYQLGIEFRFFDPNAGAPVGQIGRLIAADYDDQAALESFLDGLDVVTYEFESIPLAAVEFVAERVKVFPPVKALVFIAVHGPQGTASRRYQFGGTRATIRERAAQTALDLVRRHLSDLPLDPKLE